MDQIHTIKELCCDSLPHEGQAGHARSAHTTAEICDINYLLENKHRLQLYSHTWRCGPVPRLPMRTHTIYPAKLPMVLFEI